MMIRRVRVAIALFVSLSIGTGAQEKSASSADNQTKTVELKAGQVWKTVSAVTVILLKIEDLPKIGRVIHVRVEDVPAGSCGSVRLTKTIDHIALTEEMARRGLADMVKENTGLPDSYFFAYREWEKQKKHKVLKVPLRDAIAAESALPGPMICNLVPNRS